MPKKKKAIIIGITGQDGSYLAEFLLKKNTQFMHFYEVNKKIKKIDFGE